MTEYDKQLTIRLPADLHAQVVALATEDERSINQMYVLLIRRAVTEQAELKAIEERGARR